MKTETSFDLARLRDAIEHRDAAAQLAMYAPDAEIMLVDRNCPPSSPRVLHGREQIREMLDDVCSREMTHAVQQAVLDEDGLAFTEICRYPDGTNVVAATICDVADGHIARQTVVQAWDE